MWKLKIAEGGRDLLSVNNFIGRQHWEFDPDAGTPDERAEVERLRQRFTSNRFINKRSSDAFMRIQMRKEKEPRKAIPAAAKAEGAEDVTMESVATTLKRGVDYLCSIQANDGHWPCNFSDELFLTPPIVMTLYATCGISDVLSSEHQREIKRYIYNHQNEDGGWGLYAEGHSTIFGSTFNYVALRLLGEGPDDGEYDATAKGRKWILDHGGAVGIPSWGKFFLSVIGVYEWDGCNPLPPEVWLLPTSSSIPGGMLCYPRLIYMSMSYLYGKRFVGKITPLIQQLRKELYLQPYHLINWSIARNTFAKEDIYYPHPLIQDLLWGFLYNVGEPLLKFWPFSRLREKALQLVMDRIHYEDINSRYVNIGCFAKMPSFIACWNEDPNSEACKLHLARLPDYLWLAEDGMSMMGVGGSQTWDATLAIQAIISSDLTQEYAETLRKAHEFIKASQVRENPSGDLKQMYRHISKGAWTFSIRDHGWQVSDCTAEALKVALLFSLMPEELVGEKMRTEHLYDAVDFLLTYQSDNGGIPAWEPLRAYRWLEKFNPTESFENCLIETEHVECTSSVIQALTLFKKLHPRYRSQEIKACTERVLQYILQQQKSDGSWKGDWAICFTYGTWFAVEALIACGMSYNNCPALRKACEFLLSKQLPDGDWGESHLSYTKKEYTNIEGNKSNLVQTSWALLALIKVGQVEGDPTPIKNGVKLLINSQLDENGDFPEQEATGSFFNSCSLHYATFRNIFPVWALGEYRRRLLIN